MHEIYNPQSQAKILPWPWPGTNRETQISNETLRRTGHRSCLGHDFAISAQAHDEILLWPYLGL